MSEQVAVLNTISAEPPSPKETAQAKTGFNPDFAEKLKAITKTEPVAFKDNTPAPEYNRDKEQPVHDPKNILAKKAEELPDKEKLIQADKTPKAEVKTEAKADDYPENAKSPEAKSSWDKLKAKAEAAEKARIEREAELLELKKNYDPEAYKKALKEAEDLNLVVRRLNVEQHPKFQETFEKPLVEAIARAAKHVPETHRKEIEKLLRQPDSPAKDEAIQAITEQIPLHKQVALSRAIEDASITLEKKAEALQQEAAWVEKFNKEQEESVNRNRVQAEAKIKTTLDTVLKEKFGDNPLFFPTSDSENQKELAQRRIQAAQSLLTGQNTPEQLAEAVYYAEYGRAVQPLLVAAYNEIERLTKAQDRIAGGNQGRASGGGSQQAPSWRDAVNAAARGEKAT